MLRRSIIIIVCLLNFSRTDLSEEQNECRINDCDSQIYCHGELLRTIQLGNILEHSRHFVDLKLKDSPENILQKFNALKVKMGEGLDNTDSDHELKKFIQDNFEEDKLESCTLTDLKNIQDVQKFIPDKNYRQFYETINEMWSQLAVKMSDHVEAFSDRHSMIYLPGCFIKTGKSNSIPQLWQNYLIVRGLLSNNMFQTAAAVIRNVAYLLINHNFVLLTNRIYASKRASLPLLVLMVEAYETATEDKKFLREMLPLLEKEFKWWYENRMVDVTKEGKTFRLFRYHQTVCGPRPEEYKEDFFLAENLETDVQKNTFFSEVRCLDESGFKFSSRFLRGNKYSVNRLNLDIMNIIPVELNSVLYRYVELLAIWNRMLGKNPKKVENIQKYAKSMQKAFYEVLWNETRGVWLDWDLREKKSIDEYRPTNLMPLYTLTYDEKSDAANRVLKYLVEEGIINGNYQPKYFVIPSSKVKSGEISDYPYGSLLLNMFVIEGLQETDHPECKRAANNMARLLIKTVYNGFKTHAVLLENYNAVESLSTDDADAQKMDGISGAALGFIINFLNWYGDISDSNDFENFDPELQTENSDNSKDFEISRDSSDDLDMKNGNLAKRRRTGKNKIV